MSDLFPSTYILDVRVDCLSKEDIISRALEWAGANGSKRIFYVNAHCLNVLYNNQKDKATFNRSDLIYADGIGVVWASRLYRRCSPQKITGRQWIEDFCLLACQRGLRIYILAGKPGVAKAASEQLAGKIKDLKIVGCSDGYFVEKSEEEILKELEVLMPDVLFVGMGTPVQERWIERYQHELPIKVYWSVGALFDYVAGLEPPVPAWMEKFALEWLWRMMIDPIGKWKRYLLGVPLFVIRVLREKFLSLL